MRKLLARCLLFLPLLLPGCDVALNLFVVPLQAVPGTAITVTIDGNIAGNTGWAGCVLQLPNGWTIQNVTNNRSWMVARDEAALLASYVAEPGQYLAAFSGTGTGGFGGGQTIPQITLTLTVNVPANALGQYAMKLSLARLTQVPGWQIMEPAGVAQFASITAAPYALPIYVGVPAPADFVVDSGGLPPELVGSNWSGAAFGDVDGDGRDDLAAVDGFYSGTRCWLSRPGTTWLERSSGLPLSTTTARIAFGHLDGDGALDLVDGNGQVRLGNGGASWTQGAPLPLTLAGTSYSSIAVGDIDGDGLADLAIGASTGRLEVLLNNGNRTFRNASAGLPVSAASDAARNLLLVDLDGDGDRDLLWAHRVTPNLWLNDGHGAWTQGLGIPADLGAVAAGDLDGDGVPEIVAAVASTGIQVFKHAFGVSWAPLPVAGLPTSGRYRALAMLDFDRDGRLDLATGGGGIDLWRNTGTGFARQALAGLPPLIASGVEDLVVGDFDGNTFPDLAGTTVSNVFTGVPGSLRAWQDRRTGVAPFGTGCAGGTFAAPQLTANGLPQRGNAAFATQVHTLAPGVIALFWFGGSRTFAPPFALPFDATPFGAPTCTLLASLDYTYFGVTDGAGDYTVALPVPTDPVLAFQTAFSQGAFFAPSANAFGMLFTGAMALRIE